VLLGVVAIASDATSQVSHSVFGPVTRIAADYSNNAGITAADVNGDGHVDLVVGTRLNDALRVYFNPGTCCAAWGQVLVTANLNFTFDVAAADVDGDGDVDLVSASERDNKIAWYENVNGSGATWFPRVITTSALGVRYIFPADMDGDGDVDVVAAHQGEGVTAWYQNAGGGSAWTRRVVSLYSSAPDKLVAADFDFDGDLDLITTSRNPNGVYWLENANGAATSWRVRNITADVLYPRAIAVGDLDGDGDLDVVSGSRNDDKIAWYENDGASPPRFAAHVLADNPAFENADGNCDPCAAECGFADGALDVHVADVDLDGDLDIVAAATHADRIFWYENRAPNAPARFTARNLANPGNPRETVLADVDGDGDLDVAFFNRAEARPGPLMTPGQGPAWVENRRLAGPAPPYIAECFDGVDNDADCQLDYPADPGCLNALGIEAPDCSDHLDNDGDGLVDLADPHCKGDPSSVESPSTCGLGFELALVLPWLLGRRRRPR
jgi:hypothetical protein